MSRHRNLGGWIAEAQDEFEEEDEDGYYGQESGHQGGEVDYDSMLPPESPVKAMYYGDETIYNGWVVDVTPHGSYLVAFEGFEDEDPQDTYPQDVEPIDDGGGAPAGGVDLDTHNRKVEEVKEVMGSEVATSDINAALLKFNYSAERAIEFLFDWVAQGRPASALKPPASKKPKASAAKATPEPKQQQPPKAKTPKTPATPAGNGTPKAPKGSSNKKGASSSKGKATTPAAGASGNSAAPSWNLMKEMDGLGLEASVEGGGDEGQEDGDMMDGVAEEAFDAVDKEEDDGRETVSLVVVGHVDAGKSTLNGHLLVALGRVDKKIMHRNERDSKIMGKSSFAFAWVLDGHAEERERGITVDVGVNTFCTEHRRIQLLDAPGHKDFVPNMISGAAQADAAVLVIDGSTGEFESGFHAGGQTVEHTVLVRSLGVQQLIVAINKLDTVGYSQERYEHIKSEISAFVKRAGYRKEDVLFIPVSGFHGENLLERKEEALKSWYCGPTLVELIDKLRPPPRPIDMGLRVVVSDVFKTQGLGLCAAGRLEAGVVSVGDKVVFRPGDIYATVKAVDKHGRRLASAKAGDSVTLALNGQDLENVRVGSVCCDPERPIPMITSFLAQILTFDIAVPLTIGFQAIMYWQSVNEPVTLTRLLCTLDKTSGEIGKKKPRAIMKQSTAIVQVTCQRPVCIELFSAYKQLGRFTLREAGASIAAGTVMKLLHGC